MFKIHYTITIFIYINYLKLYSLHKTHERMIDMAGGNEFNLDETIKFLNDYSEDTKKSLSAIKQINLENVDECTTNINKALVIIKANKDFRKKHLSTRNKDKSVVAYAVLQSMVLSRMVKLDLGGKQIDTKTTNAKSHGKSKTVDAWANLDNNEINTTTKKHFVRVSRQADVLLYQYIYDKIQTIIPHESEINLSKGFNFLTSLAKLTKRLNEVITKAQKAQKGYKGPETTEKENPNGQPAQVQSNGTNGVTQNGGSSAMAGSGNVAGAGSSATKPKDSGDVGNAVNENATSKPQKVNTNNSAEVGHNQPPKKDHVKPKKIDITTKKDKWVTYGNGYLLTYLVKTDEYRKLTEKKNKEKADQPYDETKFISAMNNASEFAWVETNRGEWCSVENQQAIKNMKVYQISYDSEGNKLKCWAMTILEKDKDSQRVKQLKKALSNAGIKLAKALQ